MNTPAIYLLGSFFLAAVFVFYWAAVFIVKKNKYDKRLEKYSLKERPAEKTKKKAKQPEKKAQSSFIKTMGSKLDGLAASKKWGRKLTQANSRMSPGDFLLYRIVGLTVVGILPYLYGWHYLLIIPGAFLGYWLPVVHLNMKIEKRLTRGTHQLAEALGTMGNSMRAGFSFMQSMKLVSEEYPDPIGPEFKKTLQDIKYGIPVEDAFMRMLKRLPDKELEMTVKAMLIQRSSGGNLATLLETIQETVSGRIRIKDEIKTLTAQGKMSSWIITGLPIGLALYLHFANPEYFSLLIEHPLGKVMMAMGGLGIIMGWIFLRKIVRIEV
ncbi:type II secretion system F family protein [Thalassobacillus devorans]|uniref:type II secretion system F family protein n=1 Tax=Thalassobacillus devorans TaxID=279813 RepID=UPI0004B6E3BA|nr:type II secretion system F family protein [Thalassobacillus devorans]